MRHHNKPYEGIEKLYQSLKDFTDNAHKNNEDQKKSFENKDEKIKFYKDINNERKKLSIFKLDSWKGYREAKRKLDELKRSEIYIMEENCERAKARFESLRNIKYGNHQRDTGLVTLKKYIYTKILDCLTEKVSLEDAITAIENVSINLAPDPSKWDAAYLKERTGSYFAAPFFEDVEDAKNPGLTSRGYEIRLIENKNKADLKPGEADEKDGTIFLIRNKKDDNTYSYSIHYLNQQRIYEKKLLSEEEFPLKLSNGKCEKSAFNKFKDCLDENNFDGNLCHDETIRKWIHSIVLAYGGCTESIEVEQILKYQRVWYKPLFSPIIDWANKIRGLQPRYPSASAKTKSYTTFIHVVNTVNKRCDFLTDFNKELEHLQQKLKKYQGKDQALSKAKAKIIEEVHDEFAEIIENATPRNNIKGYTKSVNCYPIEEAIAYVKAKLGSNARLLKQKRKFYCFTMFSCAYQTTSYRLLAGFEKQARKTLTHSLIEKPRFTCSLF